MKEENKSRCIKCHYPNLEEMFTFCPNCGYPANSNYCSDDNCEMNDPDDPVAFPETDCFCNYCGSETKYFKAGLIQPQKYD